jgi:uncharacterized membrane protein
MSETTAPGTARDPYLMFLMAISFLGLLLVGISTWGSPAKESFSWRKPLIGSLFASICLLGAFASLSPGKCSQALHLKRANRPKARGVPYAVRGHHYDCGNFSAHVFGLGGHILCSSCTGLLLGALIALALTIPYFLDYWQIEGNPLIVHLGILGVSLGLLQFSLFKGRSNVIRFFLNLYFVVGASLLLVGIDALAQSAAFALFIIPLIAFWILTRIALSEWDHRRICRSCGRLTCALVSPGRSRDDPDSHYDQHERPEYIPEYMPKL